jgi:hypothetical protein
MLPINAASVATGSPLTAAEMLLTATEGMLRSTLLAKPATDARLRSIFFLLKATGEALPSTVFPLKATNGPLKATPFLLPATGGRLERIYTGSASLHCVIGSLQWLIGSRRCCRFPSPGEGNPFISEGLPLQNNGLPFIAEWLPLQNNWLPFTNEWLPFRNGGVPFIGEGNVLEFRPLQRPKPRGSLRHCTFAVKKIKSLPPTVSHPALPCPTVFQYPPG